VRRSLKASASRPLRLRIHIKAPFMRAKTTEGVRFAAAVRDEPATVARNSDLTGHNPRFTRLRL
jgi:hypothetical protein